MTLNQIILADCMDIMRDIPDKYFELAIVDPPYGKGWDGEAISMSSRMSKKWSSATAKGYVRKAWDVVPNDTYFKDLFRISKNQIIWGGNHFNLPPRPGWIFWDKLQPDTFSLADGELAWTSFDCSVKKFTVLWAGFRKGEQGGRVHPTQKPIKIYRFLLQNYAKPGDKIIDTHSGSGSCAIACYLEGHDFLAIEKDPDYHAASVARFEEVRSQGRLF